MPQHERQKLQLTQLSQTTQQTENHPMTILLMTTAPPSDAPWYLGKKLPPLGLSYVAGALEKAGFQVQVLDNYMLKKPIDEVKELVKKLNPEIVGITCGSATFRKCVETAKAVKEALPSC